MNQIVSDNYEQLIPKIIFYLFLISIKSIALFLIDTFFNTCKKQKRRNNNNILSQAIENKNNNITSNNSELSYSELKRKIDSLTIEKERYNCPSEFAKSAKIEREIIRLQALLPAEENNNTKDLSFFSNFNMNNNTYSSFVGKIIINVFFGIVFSFFIYSTKHQSLLIPYNDFLALFFNLDEETNYISVKFYYIIIGFHVLKDRLVSAGSDLLNYFN